MNELPDNWVECTLRDVCIRTSKVNPRDYPNKKFTYIDIGGIDNKLFKVAETKTFAGSDAPSRARQLIAEGDVLFSTVRPYLKKIASVPRIYDSKVASTGFTVLRGSEALYPKYLFYYVIQDSFIKQLSKLQRGTSYPAVRNSDVFAQVIRIPPLSEQRRIVTRIEELLARLDIGVQALRQSKIQLKRYRQSVLTSAVTGQLTQAWRAHHPNIEPAKELLEKTLEQRQKLWSGRGKYKPPVEAEGGLEALPKSWVWTTLAHLANHIADGTHKTPTYVESGVPFLSAKDVNDFKLSFDNCRYIPREEHEALIKRCRPKLGNILVTKSGTIGRIAVVRTEDEFSLFESVANIPLITPLFPDFISYASHVGIAGAFGAKNKKGVAVRHLHLEDLRRLPIPLPPLAEQFQIVAEVEVRTSVIDNLETETNRQITRADMLRQSILSTAFSGRLVDQDTPDESVEALLNRISTLEKKMPKKKTPRKKITTKRATAVRNKDELIALLKLLGSPVTPERLLVESKLENNIDQFFELVREASIDKLIDSPVGDFGTITLLQS